MKADGHCTAEELAECQALVRLRARWRPRTSGLYWTAAKVRKHVWLYEVHLVGPGPCRSNLYVPVRQFLRDWEPA